jgi:catechol 2,3-dioxygenase-like lactoylglutathione lyase family enzyme
MFDHMGFAVVDFRKNKIFYEKALGALGIGAVMQGDDFIGFGRDGRPQFWIGVGDAPTTRMHIAFVAKDRAAVQAFYDQALAAGGRDNGPPGLRPQYHSTYYGAFVIDPNGHNIEAVCHSPEG